jgi:SAM-dependent methyltransferase
MAEESYVIRGGVAGYERLKLLSRVFRPITGALFDRVGIAEGMHCLDVGCGGGEVTFDLAERVGPRGVVVGVDLDDTKIGLARRDAEARGMRQARFVVHDILAGGSAALPGAPFQRIHARFLLSHLTRPAEAVAAMVGLLAPGGALIVTDVDFSACFCRPDVPAFRHYVECYREAARARGANPDIGPDLPLLLSGAGLEGVEIAVVQPAGLGAGDSKLLVAVTAELITDATVAAGLATAAEMNETVASLHRHAADDVTVLSNPRIVQSWGWRPA